MTDPACARSGPASFVAVIVLAFGGSAAVVEAAVEVEARLARSTLTLGETATLEVTVQGAVAGIKTPEFEVPPGLELLGSGRSQRISTINGRIEARTVFRFELAAHETGRFRIGPIRVRVGKQVFQGSTLTLAVLAATTEVEPREGGSHGPATLVVDLNPPDPYVGQPVILRVRLIQRASLAEDPRYTPPATTGFWSERAGQPESYYADEKGRRVLVTETRTRLYPIATGSTTIGAAVATLALSVPQASQDPLQWFRGRPPRREVVVRSKPVELRVRSLPSGAPAGFGGAVGDFSLGWWADRARTSRDVSVTARLEVRGVGNLPLIQPPTLAAPDFEVLGSSVEDSGSVPGSRSSGRRRFQWTLLPRSEGRLEIRPPLFAWFDPVERRYRDAALDPIALEVGPPLTPAAPAADAFPGIFTKNPVAPFARPAVPWGFALAGLALGGGVRLWRRASRPPPDSADRARQREWIHAVSRGRGPDFWSASDRACEWLAERDRPVAQLRHDITAARYGGRGGDPEAVRTRLMEQLRAALPPPAPSWTPRLVAAALAVSATVLLVLLGPRDGDPRAVARAQAADRAARGGDVEAARSTWNTLWKEGAREASLAARLAWVEAKTGEIGPASLWVLRGEQGEPRDPALAWVMGQIRDAGGLAGYAATRLPVRSVEWALLALVAGLGTAWVWPRRQAAAAGLALLLLCASVPPFLAWRAERLWRGVVKSEVHFEGTELELSPGQVVTVLQRDGSRAQAAAGPGLVGWVPAGALVTLERTP